MSDVKGPRQRSARTKRAIVAAAHDLFTSKGYAATTLQEIAGAAGVAVQTVYFHFGTKSRLLKEVVDVRSAGDDEPVALLERDWFARLRAATDPAEVLTGWVRASGLILARVAPILAVVRDAAPTDPEMAGQWTVNSRQRRQAHAEFVTVLGGLGALPPAMSEDRASDITVALLSPELFLVLTRECGWSREAWEAWALDHLRHDLLGRSQAH
ncbi:TetR/AcrR family transcriptional regulator [Dactylosporangium sp. CA-233914]|uniref:TetR/AcrR family transcriptional regulator n=1 Tax=Dactylosporangium sp. CA-233914 TaxID=3239934 RepID=UPI003D90BD06